MRSIILGCAVTGAKYTPLNHKNIGDPLYDAIMSGSEIETDLNELHSEAEQLHDLGVRYYHYHGRNPCQREQTTDIASYASLGMRIRKSLPDMVLSYGASRNGKLVREAIRNYGETCRALHSVLPLQFGGAEFITIQAAAELQIISDAEKQGIVSFNCGKRGGLFHTDVNVFSPSSMLTDLKLEVNSTFGGGNYGSTSSAMQFDYYKNIVLGRRISGGDHEVEWVQQDRSYAMTRFAIEHDEINLGETGKLSITILFGFSPKLPFPIEYSEFRQVVALAKSLECRLKAKYGVGSVTIGVGAAILPHHACAAALPMDIGPQTGRVVSPLERLVAYACQPDAQVDVLRFGMEDTPFLMDGEGRLLRTNNVNLGRAVLSMMEANGCIPETDNRAIERALLQNTVKARRLLMRNHTPTLEYTAEG